MTNIFDIIKGQNLEPEAFDRSLLEDYATCPFCASKVKSGEVKDGGELAESGQACHEIIADCLTDGMDYAELIDLIPDMARQARPDIQTNVIASLKGISKAMKWHDPTKIIGVEKQLSAELMPATPKRGAVIVTSRLDLLIESEQPHTVICTDFKTGWRHRTDTEAMDAFQTQCAAWLIWRNYETIETVIFFYSQTRDGRYARAELERERDFHNFLGRIQSATDLAMAGSVVAWPGKKCSYCPAVSLCPEVTSDLRDFDKDHSAYFGQLIALEGRVDAMKDVMKAHCSTDDREIKYKDEMFGYAAPNRVVSFKRYTPKKPKPPKTKKESKK